jgi:hypothetical protein
VFVNGDAATFGTWVEHKARRLMSADTAADEKLLFINAWNEWAEGAHLEPDERFGRGWLEAVRNAQEPEHLLTNRRNAKAW